MVDCERRLTESTRNDMISYAVCRGECLYQAETWKHPRYNLTDACPSSITQCGHICIHLPYTVSKTLIPAVQAKPGYGQLPQFLQRSV